MFSNINFNLLKYFYEVVNIGNITKASKILMVSQPAITRSIKELEEQIGVKLLERSKKGVEITPAGEILYKNISKMYTDFNSTLNAIETLKNNGGYIYIGATTTNFLTLIEEPLKKFKEKYPNIHVDIVLEEIRVLEERRKLGKLDIIIKNDYEHIEDFISIKTFKVRDKFIASKQHYAYLENKKLKLKEILELPTVMLSTITHGRKMFDQYLKQNNISFKPTYEFNSYSLCRELIKEGFGIGIGNPEHYKDDNDFIILDTEFDLLERTFDIGYIKTSKNDLIKDFINII